MSRKMGGKTYLTSTEVAEVMGVSLRTVQRWIARGGLISKVRRRRGPRKRMELPHSEDFTRASQATLFSEARPYFSESVQSPAFANLVRQADRPAREVRLDFFTDPSSGFHYFLEDEVRGLMEQMIGGVSGQSLLREPQASRRRERRSPGSGPHDVPDKEPGQQG